MSAEKNLTPQEILKKCADELDPSTQPYFDETCYDGDIGPIYRAMKEYAEQERKRSHKAGILSVASGVTNDFCEDYYTDYADKNKLV